MVVLAEAFAVSNRAAVEPKQNKRPFPLSRRLAQELALASVFSVTACADLTAEVAPRVYATDASLSRGAACSCAVPAHVAKALWQNGDRRGAYSRLEEGPRVLLKAAGLAPEGEDVIDDVGPQAPLKQVPFDIDVLEIGCCSGFLGGPGVKEGVDLGPLISPANSRFYDVLAPHFSSWLSDMLQGGWVRGLMLTPPCSLCRSGPCLAYWRRCLALFHLACACGAPCVLLPGPACLAFDTVLQSLGRVFRCELRWLSSQKLGEEAPGGLACVCAGFDGGHLDSFVGHADFGSPFSLGEASRRLLGKELLRCFSRTFLQGVRSPEKLGIESVAVNDVLASGPWRVDTVLPWRGDSHINVLELATVVALHRQLATSHADCRLTILVDSQVAKSAAAKGRSSSRSLSFALMRSAALQVSFGLFIAYGFAPTRLNVADDPTRFAALRAPARHRLFESLPAPAWHSLSALRMRRPLASWARLFLFVALAGSRDRCFLLSLISGPFSVWLSETDHSGLDFDSTLGFPGEGPLCPSCHPVASAFLRLRAFLPAWPVCACASSHPFALVVELFLLYFEAATSLLLRLDFDSTLGFPGEGWFRFGFLVLLPCAMAVVAPSTPAEHERAKRRSPVLLVADRVVRPVTRSNRERLSNAFDEWLREVHGVSLRNLLDTPGDVSEKVAGLLVGYGQALFRGGHPYYKYSETINAVAALKPSIRRSLTYAWDLAFAWLSEEPHCHHKAMPLGILLAVLSAALAWGWAAEAALFGLAWTGLLRPGEVLAARRSDLILPRDAAPGTAHALLVIRNPKTRGRAARHQSARVDPVDIIKLLDAVFGNLPGHVLLWQQSAATLRRRLEQIQERLGLIEAGKPAFDLSSFRPGGATWTLNTTENSELVRRRGRWLSLRVMDIYLQEVVAITYLPSLEPATRACIDALAAEFTTILERTVFFISRGIPRSAWFVLLRPQA